MIYYFLGVITGVALILILSATIKHELKIQEVKEGE